MLGKALKGIQGSQFPNYKIQVSGQAGERKRTSQTIDNSIIRSIEYLNIWTIELDKGRIKIQDKRN